MVRRSLWLLLPVLALAAGCDFSHSKCARVVCEGARICDEATGACKADPNAKDGGSDGGLSDGGATCTPDCATGSVCDPVSHACVACVQNSDCACPNPSCDVPSHTCTTPPPDAGVPALVIGDSCGSATAIPFPFCATTSSFQVDLSTLADDAHGSCSALNGGGRDAVFLLNLDATYDVRVVAVPAGGSGAAPVTYLRRAPCTTGDELICVDGLGGNAGFALKSLPKGQYALVIDAYDQVGSAKVNVTVQLLPPTLPSNDTCGTALDAPLDGGTFSVDLGPATDDYVGTCNATKPDSRDAVWKVTLDTTSDFHALATAQTSGMGVEPVLYLRRAPCATGFELACIDRPPPTPDHLRARALAPGTYYLFVEGYGPAGSGAMQVSTWATAPVPPPPNDTCAAPRLLTFAGGVGTTTFTVDTSDATDDTAGSCSDSTLAGPEVVYQLSLPGPRTVTVTAERTDGGFADPVLYLRGGACAGGDAGMELGCSDNPSDPAAAEVLSQLLPAGDYFLFVDSYDSSSAGPTVVTVALTP